ncbi:hypothetical protein BCR33DRAFT_763263 [Rhizoclosmatium globosum]|uniref:PTR2-domain-containing protein n=1 Tax=Rhizoclosmatium globosum TaxID=329046 RepID=A0A1Y2CR44_9FUNG|nr:hypothetical protein BCR33DRAFT_763263 [Rhizoclosmatium globosum]|eukprot:ORY49501.1 hypothetical protein BCR33DRAFT_763263 [Rhizoclosmatium globosum]
MAEKDLKQYEEGIDGVLPKATDFDGLDLTPNELRLKKLEIEMNAHIDAKIMQNPDKMPTAVWFIIPNELGERFCYYGLTPILKNFLKYQLGYLAKVDANFMYHIFQDHHHPLHLYAFGFLLLTITAWPTIMGVETTKLGRVGPLLALLCICFGTGGIKPCVSAHGGDQFLDVQKYGLQKFYNYFYMAINTGALVASYASPAIQKKEFFKFPNDTLALWEAAHVHPTGNGYPQAFLMLTCFMTAAVAVFVFGYRYYRVVPPKGSFILTDIFKTAFAYWGNRSKLGAEEAYKKTCETHTEGAVVEMMDLGKVIAAIWPAPIFWMAFNQNGTVWQDLGDQMSIPFGGEKETSFFDSATVNKSGTHSSLLSSLQSLPTGCSHTLTRSSVLRSSVLCSNVNANCYDGAPIDLCQSSTSIAWQILMYFFITFSECLFSISGLNFCYIEVGKRTKSFCAALWLFTVGTGSFLTSALLEATLGATNTTWTRETFFYLVAGMCFGSAIIQYLISRWYVPKALRPTAHL